MIVELKATKRTVLGKGVQAIRDKGAMPAVVYGPKQEATPIEVSQRDFSKALETAGESTVVQLSVDGTDHNVLIHDIDRDPVTGQARHVDFYAIVKGQKLKVDVPLEFVGEAPAVKELNANLVKALHELEVEADPMNLPKEIIVDVSVLSEFGQQIVAGDLKLPDGVALITDKDEVVATVLEVKEEEVVEVVAPDMAAIGISEERGKKEEEGTEPAGGEAKE
jgi:large subunit ribosomal protein L25